MAERSSGNSPRIPEHELLLPIGAGAYGEVWLARNAVGTLRALKMVRRDQHDSAESFQREFKGLKKFEPVSRTHENLVDILTVGLLPENAGFYYVMELADNLSAAAGVTRLSCSTGHRSYSPEPVGPGVDSYAPHTLRAELNRRGPLPAEEVIRLGIELSQAIGHLHANGLVHRDIKPSNVIFIAGKPKLADAGLVAPLDDARSLVGTAGYIAPEGPGTPQADLFALGVVLYEAAFGMERQHFPRLPMQTTARPDHRTLLQLNAVLLRVCATDPRHRYPTAASLCSELSALLSGRFARRQLVRKMRRTVAFAAAFACALLIFASVKRYLSLPKREKSRVPEANRLYAEAAYHLHKMTPDARTEATNDLYRAVQLDPGFIKAHFAIFEAEKSLLDAAIPKDPRAVRVFDDLAEKLRRIGPDSAEYHTVNSYCDWLGWRFDRALAEAEEALRIDNRFCRAHQLKAFYLLFSKGDAEHAAYEYGTASLLDPTDVATQFELSYVYLFRRDFPAAIAACQRAVRLEPSNILAHLRLGQAYEANSQFAEALSEYEAYARLASGNSPQVAASFAKLQAALRNGGPREWWLLDYQKVEEKRPVDYYWLAGLCVKLGRTSEVLPFLKKAFEQHNLRMPDLLVDPIWDSLHGDPGFESILSRVGLAQNRPR